MAPQNILLVEKELLSRDLLSNHLRHFGFTVHLASGSSEALKRIQRSKFSLAIISSLVGEKALGELIARIRAGRRDPVIFLIASQPGAFNTDSLKKIGAYDTIVKPFRLEDVKLKMQHALELLALRKKNQLYSEKLQRLEKPLKGREPVEERVKIPDLASLELDESSQAGEPEAAGADRPSPSRSALLQGEKEYLKHKHEPAGPAGDVFEQIRRLDELRKSGILTEREFTGKKTELLERI